MFRFAIRAVLLAGFVVGSVAVVVATPPRETAAPLAAIGWGELGSGSASGGGISHDSSISVTPSLAVGPNGALVVAWSDDGDGDYEIYVRRWNGSAWVDMGTGSASGGGISNNSSVSVHPALAIGPDSLPIVAWDDYGVYNPELYVRRWNGATWVEMGAGSASGGGISNNNSVSDVPSLAIGPDGTPIIAWEDYNPNPSARSEIYIRRWNGVAWVEMGASSASGGGISDDSRRSWLPSLAISPDGIPVVAWHTYEIEGPNSDIYARRWNGTAWVEIGAGSASGGGINGNDGNARFPSLAIGPDGTAVVAWDDDNSGNFEIFVRRYSPKFAYTPLTLVLPCWPGPGETEPNNSTAQANGPLCPGHAYTGLPDDRYDVFSLDALAGPLTVELVNHAGTGVQLQLHHQTITSNPIAIDYNGADGYRLELANAPPGRYYIVISTLTPDPTATTRYTLTTTFNMSR